MDEADETKTKLPAKKDRKINFRSPKVIAVTILAAVLVGIGGYAGYVRALTPGAIWTPKLEHAHARMQVLVNGTAVNFGEEKYQTPYDKDSCTEDLPASPIHFHDKKDQFVHFHWKGMTGGMVLKYYGLNMIGGSDDILGYRTDTFPPKAVPIFGNVLPEQSKDAKLWVYTGDENGYKERSQDDFLQQDVETFFGKKSLINSNEQATLLDTLMPKALAHNGHNHVTEETDQERLTRINNLLGNVVVFAQKDKPNDEQVKARFSKLEPLSESTCGG